MYLNNFRELATKPRPPLPLLPPPPPRTTSLPAPTLPTPSYLAHMTITPLSSPTLYKWEHQILQTQPLLYPDPPVRNQMWSKLWELRYTAGLCLLIVMRRILDRVSFCLPVKLRWIRRTWLFMLMLVACISSIPVSTVARSSLRNFTYRYVSRDVILMLRFLIISSNLLALLALYNDVNVMVFSATYQECSLWN